MTQEELLKIMPYSYRANREKFAAPLTEAMLEFNIDTPRRQAFFLAQVAHESGSLQYVCEIASGGAYEGRMDLGNDEPGDGPKFRGHGLFQVTGKENHFKAADYFGVPREDICEWLQTPMGASRSAGWFWATHNMNESADANDLRKNTLILNGGYNGLIDRGQRLTDAKRGLGLT